MCVRSVFGYKFGLWAGWFWCAGLLLLDYWIGFWLLLVGGDIAIVWWFSLMCLVCFCGFAVCCLGLCLVV